MGKKQSNTLKEILLAIGNGLFALAKGLFRLIFKIIVSFGLYLPGFYALFGYILNLTTGFDPFDFKVYSVVYLSGGVACVICAIIISVRNIIVMPAKSIFGKRNDINEKQERIKEDWADVEYASEEQQRQSENEKKELELAPPVNSEVDTSSREQMNELDELLPQFLIDDADFTDEEVDRNKASNLLFDWLPKKTETSKKTVMKKAPKKEIPEIYYSKLQPNILVHEYSDRFELFKTVGDKTVSVGVEYK